MKKTNLFFPILIGSIFRILWSVYKGIPFTSDSAVFGLMAKHIMNGKEYPFFFYGQSYLGAATSYILSFIMRFSNDRMLPFIIYGTACSIILYVLLVFFVKNVLGDKTAWWVSLLMIAPPYYLSVWLMGVYGYYIYLFAGIIYLWSIAEWIKNDFKINISRLMLNGFIAGLGWYTHPMFFYFIALFVLFLAIWFFKYGKMFIEFFEKLFVWILLFFVGSFLYWLGFIKHFNEYNPIRSFKFDVFIFIKGFLYALWEKIPVLFSVDKGFLPLRVIILFIYIGLLFFILSSMFNIIKDRKIAVRDIFILFSGITVIIYSFEQPYYSVENVRHLIPLVIVWPVIITLFLDKYFNRKNFLRYSLVFILLIHNVTSAFCYVNPNKNITKLISYLENNNFTKGFADYWISYYINYISDEKIIVAPFYDVDRYSEYSIDVISSDEKFYLFDLNNEKQVIKYDKFTDCLNKAKLIYKEDAVGNYRVFHSLNGLDGSKISYITPLFKEYFNKDEFKKDKLWQKAFFMRVLPVGAYRIKMGVSSEFAGALPVNKKIVTLIGNYIDNPAPFVMIEFKNEEFKKVNFLEKKVVFYIAKDNKLCFFTFFLKKMTLVEYIIIQDSNPAG